MYEAGLREAFAASPRGVPTGWQHTRGSRLPYSPRHPAVLTDVMPVHPLLGQRGEVRRAIAW
jgi:hypothetical protein